MLDITTTLTEVAPLLFSPNVGDRVLICDDVLVEVARQMPGQPPSWRFLPGGMTGKVLGWRGEGRAIVDVYGFERRLVVYMAMRTLTIIASRRSSLAPPADP